MYPILVSKEVYKQTSKKKTSELVSWKKKFKRLSISI